MCCNVIPCTYSNLPCISHISVFSKKGNPRPTKDELKYHRWLNLRAGSQIVDENLHGYLWMHASTVSSIHQAWVSMIEGVPTRRWLLIHVSSQQIFQQFPGKDLNHCFCWCQIFTSWWQTKNSVQQIKPFVGKNKCPHYEGEIWDCHIQTLGYSMLPNYIANS